MISIRFVLTVIGSVVLAHSSGFYGGMAVAGMVYPESENGPHTAEVRLAYAAPAELYRMEITASEQEDLLQEIRMYSALDALIQQLKLDLQVEGEASAPEIILELPVDTILPLETEQPDLQLEFEIHPDATP